MLGRWLLLTIAPLLYALTTRRNGKSWRDFLEFLKGD